MSKLNFSEKKLRLNQDVPESTGQEQLLQFSVEDPRED